MKRLPIWIATTLLAAGCSDRTQDLVAIKIELTALKQELELIREHAEDLDPRVRTAEEFAIRHFEERGAAVRLDCDQNKVSVLQTPLAPLSVICEQARPAIDGHQLKLKIGNPTSGRLIGWGLTFYVGHGADRAQSERRVHVEIPAQLPPGSWTQVDVVVPALGAADFDELAVRAHIGTMALAQK